MSEVLGNEFLGSRLTEQQWPQLGVQIPERCMQVTNVLRQLLLVPVLDNWQSLVIWDIYFHDRLVSGARLLGAGPRKMLPLTLVQ